MAKKLEFDWKNFLLQKGEKVGLGVAVGIMALFLVFGIKHIFSGSTPSANAEALNKKTKAAQDLIVRNTPKDPEQFKVDPSIKVASNLDVVKADAFRESRPMF